MNKRYYLYLITGLTIVSILILWLLKPTSVASLDDERVLTVKSSIIEQGDFAPGITLYGTLDSPQKSTLAARLAAKVVDVHVREGQFVRKDELLIVQDDREFQLVKQQKESEIKRLKASIDAEIKRHQNDRETIKHLEDLVLNNQKMLKRYETLRAKKLGADAQVEDAMNALLQQQINLKNQELSIKNHPNQLKQLEAQLDRSIAELKQAKLDLSFTKILAPFEGKIIELFVSNGDDVSINQKLVSLYNINDVELTAQLPNGFINQINHLEHIIAIPEAFPKQQLPFLRLGAALSKGDVSVDIFFKVPRELAERLPLGYTMTVHVSLEKIKDVFRVPATALYGNHRIYAIVDGRLSSINVRKVGEQMIDNKLYYLIEGASLHQQLNIMTSRLPEARDGLKVKSP